MITFYTNKTGFDIEVNNIFLLPNSDYGTEEEVNKNEIIIYNEDSIDYQVYISDGYKANNGDWYKEIYVDRN